MSLDFHEKWFKPPMEERLLVYPKPRQQLFLNLVENYKLYFPKLDLIYAGLNFDSNISIDYLIIFHAIKDNRDIVVWDCPFLYTNRAIPAYRYAVKNNLQKEFFQECSYHFCKITQGRFMEFIESNLCDFLSFDKDDKRYWKDPKNASSLMKGMSELSLQFKPEGYRHPNRPKEYF